MNRRDFNRWFVGAAGALLFPWRTAGAQGLAPGARTSTQRVPRTAVSRQQPMVNAERLQRLFDELAEFGATEAGGTHRVAYGEEDRAARAWILDRMREAGLEVRVDAAANILGRRGGTDPELPPLLMGSHIDSVPDGGRFDGNVGSLGALEAAWTMRDTAIDTRHPIEVVIFQNEEGGLYGSHAMAGRLDASDLGQTSQSGKTVAEGIRFLGGNPDNMAAARRRRGEIAAYVELHIEQSGILDEAGTDIGVVEGIVGIEWWTVTVEGVANHAGTTPMDRRSDALLAAAEFVRAVNEVIRGEPGRQVGTVGQIEALPGAPNVVPGHVVLSLEIRDLDGDKMLGLYERIRQRGLEIGEASGTTFSFESRQLDIVPEPTDARVRDAIAAAADGLGLSHRPMPSGAGHDAQSLAPIAPIGMIFVPSVGGISHSPRELTRPEDIVNGANVLLRTMLALDTMNW
ncbi:MAG: Zn-dependent hydrolase [Longimicrobiales bacterium]